ncbi:MAG: SDR family oxidoreductase [Sphingomonadaceae bacterium]|nr:SDR family oxidoreductase [Sphingomonadaceae bacterium]
MADVLLVTGASSGLGVEIAAQAAQAGYRTYATMRDTAKRAALDEAASAAGATIEVLPLDVTDSASVDRAIATVLEREGRIDVLIANAGVGFVRTTEQASDEDVTWVMDTNFHGVLRCTRAVLPHMRAAGRGRVVAVSSIGGLVGQPMNEIYCASKFALEGYFEALSTYVTPAFGVHFTVVEPGAISSDFAANVMQQIGRSGGLLEDDYAPIMQRYLADREWKRDPGLYQSPAEVAAKVMEGLAMDCPPLRMRTSDWAENFCQLKTGLDPDGLKQAGQVSRMMLGEFTND